MFSMKIGSSKNFSKAVSKDQPLREKDFHRLDFSFDIIDARSTNTMLLSYPSTT